MPPIEWPMRTIGRSGQSLRAVRRQGVEVVDDVFEVLDDHPVAATLAVADVVEPVDDGPVVDERRSDVVVAPDVLPVAVGEQRDVGAVNDRGRATTGRRSRCACR